MTTPRRVLLVDDDTPLRESLKEQLDLQGEFIVADAATGASGLEKAKTELPDLVILDVGLPDLDGREVCRLMRKAGVRCPIIMLTGHDGEADEILGQIAHRPQQHQSAFD
jgi:DNA-binding response OmpR family regulator